MGLDFGGMSAWLIWILPFLAALIIPAVGKGSKKATGYVAVGLALASALFAASLLPGALEAQEVHEQVSWISSSFPSNIVRNMQADCFLEYNPPSSC